MTDDEREKALALLNATHTFPVDYALSVIALNAETVTDALKGAVAEVAALEVAAGAVPYQAQASRGGKYLSHRFSVPCRDADHVLRLYARIRAVEGVVTLL